MKILIVEDEFISRALLIEMLSVYGVCHVATNGREAIDVMQRLRNLGVKVHIDDFGTGYSSLAYLQRFAVDTLKIDRGFIQRLGSNGGGAEIVRTIITLARNLGMEALAEGIEKPEQLTMAREMGCDFAQGYLFSKPLPEDEITELLVRGPMVVS